VFDLPVDAPPGGAYHRKHALAGFPVGGSIATRSNAVDRRRFFAVGAGGVAAAGLAGYVGCGKGGGGDTLKIVSCLPRTGSAKGQTNTIVHGIEMAISEYNSEIAGMKIEYQDMDDATAAAGQWAPEAETAIAQKAAADSDVMAVIGPYNSGAAKVSMPFLNEAGLLQVSPAVTWPGLTKKVRGVEPNEPEIYRPAKRVTFCRVCTTDDVQGSLSADFAFNDLKVKKVYILDDKELYGQGIAKIFHQRCEELGITVLGHQSINVTSQEFTGLMTNIKTGSPDLLYFGGTTQSKGGQVAKDMVKVGLMCPFMGPDGCYEDAFLESAGVENLNDRAYVTVGGVDPSELTGSGAEFVKRYIKKYEKDPEAYAVYGYEAAKVVLEAIKKVGKKDREAIMQAALSTKDFSVGAIGKWSFDANGDISLQKLTIAKIMGGKRVPVKMIDKS
jgi:branched-chain amino acid transport system substrate-binding protein